MRSWRLWLGLAVSLLFLGLLFLRVDVGETVESLGEANYLYLVPAVALYFLAVAFRTFRWRFLLSHLQSITVGRLYLVVVVGYMANNLLPMRLGEVVRSYYLGQREGVSRSAGLATIVVERVFDGLTLLLFLAVALLALLMGGLLRDLTRDAGVPLYLLILGTTVLFLLALGLLVAVAYRPEWPVRLMVRVAHRLPGNLGPGVVELTGLFVGGLSPLRYPRRMLALLGLSVPVWLMEAAMYYVIGFSFGLQDSFSSLGMMAVAVLATTATSNLATSVPSFPGGIGPFELFATATLVALGVSAPLATAYTVTLHVALLVPVTLVGLVVAWGQNISLRELVRMGREQREEGPGYAFPDTAKVEK